MTYHSDPLQDKTQKKLCFDVDQYVNNLHKMLALGHKEVMIEDSALHHIQPLSEEDIVRITIEIENLEPYARVIRKLKEDRKEYLIKYERTSDKTQMRTRVEYMLREVNRKLYELTGNIIYKLA